MDNLCRKAARAVLPPSDFIGRSQLAHYYGLFPVFIVHVGFQAGVWSLTCSAFPLSHAGVQGVHENIIIRLSVLVRLELFRDSSRTK